MACCGWGELVPEAGAGDGSDMRGRIEDDDELLELFDCLVDADAPAPSLAEEVRLPELDCSSGCVAGWDFWAMTKARKITSDAADQVRDARCEARDARCSRETRSGPAAVGWWRDGRYGPVVVTLLKEM